MATAITTETTTRSNYKSIDWKDFAKSAGTAAFTTLLTGLVLLTAGKNLPSWLQIEALLLSVVNSFLGNLARSFVTNSQGQFLRKDPDIAIEKEASNT